jgi:hypothetical protein
MGAALINAKDPLRRKAQTMALAAATAIIAAKERGSIECVNELPYVIAAMVVAAATVLIGWRIGGWSVSNAAEEVITANRTLPLSATGRVEAEPDIDDGDVVRDHIAEHPVGPQITTGVMVEDMTAREALSRNNALMRNVVNGLKNAGIAAKDIQTSDLKIQPRYDSRSDTSAISPRWARCSIGRWSWASIEWAASASPSTRTRRS